MTSDDQHWPIPVKKLPQMSSSPVSKMLLYRTENWSANQIAATCQAALHVSGHGYTQNVDPHKNYFCGKPICKIEILAL